MIFMTPIAVVKNSRVEIEDDNWGDAVSVIELDPSMPDEALFEIESFSHAEVIYYFHLVPDSKIETGSRHPRNNTAWPKVGILSQRGKNRPNRLGATIVKVLKREGVNSACRDWTPSTARRSSTSNQSCRSFFQEKKSASRIGQPS